MKRTIRIVLMMLALAAGVGALTLAADRWLPQAKACETEADC